METFWIVVIFLVLSPFLVLGVLGLAVNAYLLLVRFPLAVVEFLGELKAAFLKDR